MEKLCSDCKFSTPRHFGSGLVFCLHPNNIVLSKVDGAEEFSHSCATLRTGGAGHCGGNAAWFEAKS